MTISKTSSDFLPIKESVSVGTVKVYYKKEKCAFITFRQKYGGFAGFYWAKKN